MHHSKNWGLENDITSEWCAAHSTMKMHIRVWGDSEFIVFNSYICIVYITCHGYGMSSFSRLHKTCAHKSISTMAL